MHLYIQADADIIQTKEQEYKEDSGKQFNYFELYCGTHDDVTYLGGVVA